jgi:hypothetical protein
MTIQEMIQAAQSAYRPQPTGRQYLENVFAPKVHAVGQGGSLRPQTSEEIARDFYGLGDGGHPQRQMPMFQPAPAIPQYFGNDWSGMHRNIGMPYGGGMGGAVGSVLGGGAGGGMNPQRSLFGSPGMSGGGMSSLGALLGLLQGNGGQRGGY